MSITDGVIFLKGCLVNFGYFRIQNLSKSDYVVFLKGCMVKYSEIQQGGLGDVI